MSMTKEDWTGFIDSHGGLHDAFISTVEIKRPEHPGTWLSVVVRLRPHPQTSHHTHEVELMFTQVTELHLDFDSQRDFLGVEHELGACFLANEIVVNLGYALAPLESETTIRQSQRYLVCQAISVSFRE